MSFKISICFVNILIHRDEGFLSPNWKDKKIKLLDLLDFGLN